MTVLGRILCLSTAIVVALVGTILLKNVFATGSSECPDYDFPCEDGECIDSALWCDSHEDCKDKSDEKYCKKSTFFNIDPNKCPSTYFRCDNGPCIPLVGRCDGYDHCDDSSDEKNCEQTSPNGITSPPSASVTPTLENVTTESTKVQATTPTPTEQPRIEIEPQPTHFPESHGAVKQTVELVFSDFQHSDYSVEREKARNWIVSERSSDFGWGEETARALTALYLSDVRRPTYRDESDALMVKQLELQLSLEISRNGTKTMKLTDLALYLNALLASCKDPKNFYGENLVQTLRDGVNAAQRQATIVNPSVYLALCLNNASTYDDVRKLHDILLSRSSAIGRTDIQALSLLAITCIYRKTNFLTAPAYDGLRRQFIKRINVNGFPGNVYEASLLFQALQELNVILPGLSEFILSQQQEDGSFGSILATYLALPILAGRSFLQMYEHCSQIYSTDLVPIKVLKHMKRRKIFVQYSLNYGSPIEVAETIQMQVPDGINFLDVMRLAQEINPKFRFMIDSNREIPVVYSLGGTPNDAEKGMFWTLCLVSGAKEKNERLSPYLGNIKELIPLPGDEFVFWMKSL